jgi:hypothetical protein
VVAYCKKYKGLRILLGPTAIKGISQEEDMARASHIVGQILAPRDSAEKHKYAVNLKTMLHGLISTITLYFESIQGFGSRTAFALARGVIETKPQESTNGKPSMRSTLIEFQGEDLYGRILEDSHYADT